MSLVAQYDLAVSIILFILGSSLASFFNAQVYRIEQGMKLTQLALTPSHCENCGKALNLIELVPVFGWLIAGGKCKACGYQVPAIYPLTELALGITLVILYLTGQPIIYFVVVIGVAFLALYDLQHQGFPAFVMDSYLILGVLYFALMSFINGEFLYDGFYVGIPLVILLMLINLYKPSFGGGDLLLLLLLSLLMDWTHMVAVFWFAAVVGGLVGVVILRLKGGEKDLRIPFVPFIFVGILLALTLEFIYLPYFEILKWLW